MVSMNVSDRTEGLKHRVVVDRWPVVYHSLTNHNISGFYEIVLISTHMSYFEENNLVYGNTDSVGQGHFLNQKTSILARNSICCPMDH